MTNNTAHFGRQLSCIVHFATFFALMAFVIGYRVFPYADEWGYVAALDIGSLNDFVHWLFAQHVDHRIPLQKLLQFSLAEYSGFDFRVLVLANLIIAASASLVLAAMAREYRGYQDYGDLIIPLILMSPAAGYSLWAFELQFLSCIVFVSVALFFAGRYAKKRKTADAVWLVFQVFLVAWCGLNGLIFSTVLAGGLGLYWGLGWLKGWGDDRRLLLLLLPILAQDMALWLLWSPSAATAGSPDLISVVSSCFTLLSASMVVFMFTGTLWKSALVAAAVLLAFSGLYIQSRKRTLDFADLFLCLCLVASFVLILSVPLGRGTEAGGLSNGLSMHYSFLTVLVPILSWILISRSFPTRITGPIGIGMVLLFGAAYLSNTHWRHEHMNVIYGRQQTVEAALRRVADIPSLVNEYTLDLTWQSDDNAKRPVVQGLAILRGHGFRIYELAPSVE